MAERREQEKPLSPFTPPLAVDKRTPFAAEFISRRRYRCLKCCGCAAALFLILAVTILILMITVLHIKDPTLELNSVKINGLDLLSNTTNNSAQNLTLVADISIKNPNTASFKFDASTTDVFYDGTVVGEVRAPEGEAAARRTRRMNVSVDVMVERMVGVSRFESDLIARNLTLSTSTSLRGVVKIADVVKRSFVVKMNCTVSVNLGSEVIQVVNCRRDVAL